jgi:hypothetical protein
MRCNVLDTRCPMRSALLLAAALTLGVTRAAAGQYGFQSPDYYCDVQYYRADNMWGSLEDAKKSLGMESFRLNKDAPKSFLTDWKYEKMRNDGKTYYGSHTRLVVNKGNYDLTFYLKENPLLGAKEYVLPPNSSLAVRGDLEGMICKRYQR